MGLPAEQCPVTTKTQNSKPATQNPKLATRNVPIDLNPLLPLTGFFVGALVGLTGVGRGVLMTPLLMIAFGLPPSTAVGRDLAYAAVTKVAGAWQHCTQGTVNVQELLERMRSWVDKIEG